MKAAIAAAALATLETKSPENVQSSPSTGTSTVFVAGSPPSPRKRRQSSGDSNRCSTA